MGEIREKEWRQFLGQIHQFIVSLPEDQEGTFKRVWKLLDKYEKGDRSVELFNELNDIMRGAK